MRFFTRALVFSALFFYSCLGSDGDLEKLPDAKLKSVTFKAKDTGATLTGAIEYEGDITSPSKITVNWSGELRLFRIPIADTKRITKTIYELTDGQIVRITNVNDAGVEARVEEFTYDADSYLTRHFLKEISVGGSGFLTYENKFYYDYDFRPQDGWTREAGAVQRVVQTRCNTTTCYKGIFDRIGDDQFRSSIPVTIANETGDPLDYEFTALENDVSDFTGTTCDISRSSGAQAYLTIYTPIRLDEYQSFGLPQGMSDYETSGLQFSAGNAEQLADVYYVLGQWINPVFNIVDATYDYNTGNYGSGDTYGRDNTSWIFPRLMMATTYANYMSFGYTLETTERFIDVDFKSEMIR